MDNGFYGCVFEPYTTLLLPVTVYKLISYFFKIILVIAKLYSWHDNSVLND